MEADIIMLYVAMFLLSFVMILLFRKNKKLEARINTHECESYDLMKEVRSLEASIDSMKNSRAEEKRDEGTKKWTHIQLQRLEYLWQRKPSIADKVPVRQIVYMIMDYLKLEFKAGEKTEDSLVKKKAEKK